MSCGSISGREILNQPECGVVVKSRAADGDLRLASRDGGIKAGSKSLDAWWIGGSTRLHFLLNVGAINNEAGMSLLPGE